MHNVMFIQHHMQRQDDFNAVRICSFYQSLAELTTWDALTDINVLMAARWYLSLSLPPSRYALKSAGGPGLGIRGNGNGQAVPLAILDGFHYRDIRYFVRGSVPLRQHGAHR